MPFARGAEAQDKTLRPDRHIRLVRVGYDGGIE